MPIKPKKRINKWLRRPIKDPALRAHNQHTPKDQRLDQDAPRVCRVCGGVALPARVYHPPLCATCRRRYNRMWRRRQSANLKARRFRNFRTIDFPRLTGNEATAQEVATALIAGGLRVKWMGTKRRWSINGVSISNTRMVTLAKKVRDGQKHHGWWEKRKG